MRTGLPKIYVALLLFLAFTRAADCVAQTPAAGLGGYMIKAVETSRFSGVALVARGGRVLFERAYGVANAEDDVPVTTRTRFRIGSLTKQFTAAAVLLLQERGALDVHDSVCDYLPDCPAGWRPIQIHHLLTHTSGLPDFSYMPNEKEADLLLPPLARHMERLRRASMEFEPGARFSYCNSGYVLLGHVIERASGVPYERFVSENILAPLKLADTGFDQNGLILKRRAVGYALRGESLVAAPFVDMTVPYSAGGMYSTAADLYAWEHALYSGKVISPKSLAAMLTPFKGNYGYGWYVGREWGRNHFAHGGRIEGFMSSVDLFPEDGLTVIVLCNLDSVPANRLSRDLAGIVFGRYRETPSERKAVAVDPRVFDAYVGRYEVSRNLIVSISREGGRLLGEAAGFRKVELFPESEITFFAKDLDAQITFVGDGVGGITHAIINIDGHKAEARKLP